jgi:diguanylate cyclase (GGDEF)-like protein
MADIKVLFVDDSGSSGLELKQAIKDEGLDLCFCGGGFDALDELSSDGADIVFASADLQDLSGYQLAGLIKSSELDNSLPVVLFQSKETGADYFWLKASRADCFLGQADLEDSVKVAKLLRDMAQKAQLKGWERSCARNILVASQGFSSEYLQESYSSLLNDLLLERSVNRIMRTLTAIVEPRSQFLDAFFEQIGRIYRTELFGLVIADKTSPWAAFQVKDGTAKASYDEAIDKVCKQLEIEPNKLVALGQRGRLNAGDDTAGINHLEVVEVATEKHGVGALVFGTKDQKGFSPSTKAFINILKNELRPVIQLLLAKQEIEELHTREAYRASIDSLTGLYNLEFLVGFLQQQLLFSFRQRLPVGLVIIDVDEFSKINEQHGYEFGDSVLSQIANKLLHITRSSDLLARYGGDQFAVVLPNTDMTGTRVLAEKVRSEVELLSINQELSRRGIKVTVSVGCATFNMEDLNPETILKDAKLALKQAKETGRNCVASLT